MKERLTTNSRKWFGVLMAVLLYYIVHEGAHFIVALCCGAFDRINFMGIGVQIAAHTKLMTPIQIAIFCAVGSIASLLAAYALVWAAKFITKSSSKVLKAVGYYATIALLLLDPLYLTVLYRFVGGGDMNGILLFGLPEIVVVLVYGAVGVVNIGIIVKYIYPAYKKAFAGNEE